MCDFREFNEESFINDIRIQNWATKNPMESTLNLMIFCGGWRDVLTVMLP